MKSSHLCGILISSVILASGCAGSPSEDPALPIQDIGIDLRLPGRTPDAAAIPASGVPPLGEAIAPISGLSGDGAAVVTQVGGWSGGPGAVRWHGGQWVMPYTLAPRSVLQNVSCDVWNPTTTAPANVLVEAVSSNGQVLGSATAPASTSVTFRLWPFVGTHAVIDGEQLVVRLSPKDATTSAWTTAAQDATVIGCAVNATGAAGVSRTLQVSPLGSGAPNGPWAAGIGSGGLVIPLPMANGDQIVGLRARLLDVPGMTLTVSLQSVVDGVASTVATSAASSGAGAKQTLSIPAVAIGVASGTNYQAAISRVSGSGLPSVYWIEVDVQ